MYAPLELDTFYINIVSNCSKLHCMKKESEKKIGFSSKFISIIVADYIVVIIAKLSRSPNQSWAELAVLSENPATHPTERVSEDNTLAW